MKESGYWADKAALEIIKARGDKQVIATGITPSGPIHLGNIREVLTADAVRRGLDETSSETDLIYIADTADPLRRLYPFLPKTFEKYIGMPLYRIPCPDSCCANYAEHFLKPFLAACHKLGVRPKTFRAHELYREGLFTSVISEALISKERIAAIIVSQTGRDLPEDWVPFNVECEGCKRITEAKIGNLDVASHTVEYTCSCGHSGVADYSRGMGKLPWRIDWPARWKVLGITVEPFGKDHATAGGSFDTGSAIAKEVFHVEPPYPIIYEWIYWKGKGAMASSTGVAISIQDMLDILPPEAVRFLILRAKPEKHIDFDPENGLVKLLEDYQGLESEYLSEGALESYEKRAYEMSQVDAKQPRKARLEIPFLHIVIAAQIAERNLEKAVEVLARSGYVVSKAKQSTLEEYLQYANNWLASFAADAFKFKVQQSLPGEVADLTEEDKRFLAKLADYFEDLEWNANSVHNSIHEIGKEFGLSARRSFQAVYISILGKKSGPRAGWFVTSLDRRFVIERFLEAART